MKSYEAMFILRSDLPEDKFDKTLTQIKDVLSKHKTSVDEMKEWGKQKLAYPIKKKEEGIYYLVNFHADTDTINKMRKIFNLNDAILRTLIIAV
ncbi:MAG: 30S ribosomal protein S6 [Candidatus Omnitrophota bacterium]